MQLNVKVNNLQPNKIKTAKTLIANESYKAIMAQ